MPKYGVHPEVNAKAYVVGNAIRQGFFQLRHVRGSFFRNKGILVSSYLAEALAAQVRDSLALPHHLVSHICLVLLHPGLFGLRLVPPHRFYSEGFGVVEYEMHPSEDHSST